MRIGLVVMGWVAIAISQACSVTLTEEVPATELDSTERSSFTSDGRLFVIGVRPDGRADAGSWIAEIIDAGGAHEIQNIAAGTLEGTADGRIGGPPVGDPCVFSGMKAQGSRVYAGCFDLTNGKTSLIEVDLYERTVRAGYFTSCNTEPGGTPCVASKIYPNGMAIDAEGRIYVTDMLAHLKLLNEVPEVSYEGTGTIEQITIDRQASTGRELIFKRRTWFSGNFDQDGGAANGIQIEGNVLYFAAGPNINRIDIAPSGDAGAASIHYVGPALSYIDDFAVLDGRMALARTLPPAIVALDRAEPFGTARELGTKDMSLTSIPSSITYQPDLPAGQSVFAPNSLIVTCFFGGGIYALTEN